VQSVRQLRCIRQIFIGSLALLAGVTGCTSLPPLPAPKDKERPPLASLMEDQQQLTAAGYSLGPSDVVRVSVYDNPDLSQEVTIEADGSFQYPLIGRVQAGGLGVHQLEGLLTQRLAEGYLVSPQVGVTVTQRKSQQVYIMGAVRTPGVYPLQRQSTLLEMLSAAGGQTPDAGFEVLLIRNPEKPALTAGALKASGPPPGEPFMRVQLEQLLAGSTTPRVTLRDGDVIYVPVGAFFYVSGEIVRPGRYRLEREMTVFQALTIAGGVTKFATKKSVIVQRMVDGQRRDFQGGLNDPLQAEDILVVPASLL